jgi:hypothetical protein
MQGSTYIEQTFEYTTAQTAKTISLQMNSSDNTTACALNASVSSADFAIDVEYYPTDSQQAISINNQTNWRVDANISGANVSLGTAAQTAYTGMSNGSLTLTNNTGAGVVTSMIGCDSTGVPNGVTCNTAGVNEANSVVFTVPRAGDVRACVSFGHKIQTGATGAVNTYFQIVETATNAQTILQEGRSRVASGTNTASTQTYVSNQICGTFTFASAGTKALRLFFEQEVAATVTSSEVLADAGASSGQRDIHWEVYPIDVQAQAPTLVGSVTSNSTGAERIERALITCSGASSVNSQSGSWISSVGNISSGVCVLTIASGIFSATPVCTANYGSTGSTDTIGTVVSAASATSVSVGCRYHSASTSSACPSGSAFYVICMGSK